MVSFTALISIVALIGLSFLWFSGWLYSQRTQIRIETNNEILARGLILLAAQIFKFFGIICLAASAIVILFLIFP